MASESTAPAPAKTAAPHGYIASKDRLEERLLRIEGQVRGIQRMVGDERYCVDILTQISAIQAALDKVALSLLDDHTRSCVIDATDPELRSDRTEELIGAVRRLMRRG